MMGKEGVVLWLKKRMGEEIWNEYRREVGMGVS